MKYNIKEMTKIGLFSSLTAIGAFISLPLGPVPITLQTFFVLLSGVILGSKNAFSSMTIYLFLGLSGLPVYAGGTGGFQAILKPSFGFLIGMVVSSFVVGKIYEIKKNNIYLLISLIVGTIVIYIIGLPYMYYILNVMLAKNFSVLKIFQIGMFLFIPGDIVKILFAYFLGKKLIKVIL